MSAKPLTPGASARIFRDGHHLVSQVHVPNGLFQLRHLEPGHYVARDELGGEVPFAVTATSEFAVIQPGVDPLAYDDPVANIGSGAPGQSYARPVEIPNVGVRPGHEREGEQTQPKPGEVVSVTNPRADDQRVPGAPGSAAVQEGVLGPSGYTADPETGEFLGGPGQLERRQTIAANKGAKDADSGSLWASNMGPAEVTQQQERDIRAERERDLSELSKPLAGRRKGADTQVSGPNPPTTGAADEPTEETRDPLPGETADKFPAQGEPAPGTEANLAARAAQQGDKKK